MLYGHIVELSLFTSADSGGRFAVKSRGHDALLTVALVRKLLIAYLRHRCLVRGVVEMRSIVIDIGHSYDDRNRSLLISRLHRACKLQQNVLIA
jgi:hypothetical protein